MKGQMSTASALSLGAALMYFLDPERGRRRRALVRHKSVHFMRMFRDGAGATSRDLSHRAQGTIAETRAWIGEGWMGRSIDDAVLVERVRARIGRIASHPSAIEVAATNGRITLRGPIPTGERDSLLNAIRTIRGVKDVEDRLEIYERAGGKPALQGGAPQPGLRPDIMQRNWSPTTRLLVSAAGGGLALYGLGLGGLAGTALALLGGAALARGVTNAELRRLLGFGGRRAIDVHKTININAPVDRVYAFWSQFENFPRFMSHLREVRIIGDGRSHWVAVGPAGATVRWDAIVTKAEPNRLLAWKSVEGSTIENAGIIHFDPNPDGSTRVDIRMSYNPPAGAIGHAVAAFLHSDLKTALDEDLVRLKSLIEEGKASAPGKHATLEEVLSAPPAPTETSPTTRAA